ncbi:uncharacterized protein [Apostichopus japonicus]|uniref:uncharacterized protein n=1 Tax=Stichopus japonicus TaxID=307972 RepID=UPI003AB4EF98
MYFDIAQYLSNIDNVELCQRLMYDYKEGKAYSYLESGWLGEMFYHVINEKSKFCLLKAGCRPSQRINNIPWQAWICLQKFTGRVIRGYCTCFAGLGSFCNHIGAMLFKVDLAWRTGITQQSVTEEQCSWNRYGAKKQVEPKKIQDMAWSKPHFSKHGIQSPINPVERQLFNPTHKRKKLSDLDRLTNVLMPTCPEACFLQYANEGRQVPEYPPESDFNVSGSLEVSSTPHIPSSLARLASNYESAEALVQNLPTLSSDDVIHIETETRGQVNNPTWIAQRKDRITASKVHSVITRVRTIRASETEVDTSRLVKLISGTTPLNPDLPALKYGREMEGQARNQYVKVMRTHRHPSTTVTECGLFVYPKRIYLAATPDGIVTCQCCGTGLLQIKCPLSSAHTVPSAECLPYLMDDNTGNIRLKRSHGYYYQVQMQLGVTKKNWCDFLYSQVMDMLKRG